MDIPRVVAFDAGDEDAAAVHLAGLIDELGVTAPLVVASVHGERLARSIKGARYEVPSPDASLDWASALGADAHRAGCDLVVAIGGGRCLDLAKLAAARAGLTMISAPTQLSHDGLCSPVAVALDNHGIKRSLGAIAPRSIYLSLPTLARAPVDSLRAGLGDLFANPFALRDWALAEERGLAEVDPEAWDMSERSYAAIEPFLEADPAGSAGDHRFLRSLADALILSGVAMIHSGSSRPASGGEHEISHALDELFGGPAMHGAQVAFGCIFSAALYGDDPNVLRDRVAKLGLPSEPAALGLTLDDAAAVLLAAPDTRPGRFTIIEEAALDESAARALVKSIWESE